MALTNKKNNRTCIVCGTQYYFCNHCQNGDIKPAWYNIFHDGNCHDIYNAIANILPQQGKEAAKQALDKCDLSNKKNFHPNIIKSINEIYDIVDVIENENTDEVDVSTKVAEDDKEIVENAEKTEETVKAVKSNNSYKSSNVKNKK